MSKVAVIGLWHLGSVVAAGLASLGNAVRATDPDQELLAGLERGVPPVFEPGLAAAIARERESGRLKFVSSITEAVGQAAEAVFLTFDTPVDEDDQSDLRPIQDALDDVIRAAQPGVLIVVMSQVPVGTLAQLAARVERVTPQLGARMVYQPENLRLGRALETFLKPDFLLVGAASPADAGQLFEIYAGVEARRLTMSWESAELSKHAVNAFLATSVSFANELGDLAERVGADVREVMGVLRHDQRIGARAFLDAGPGFSGGTLARDVQTLRRLGERAGLKTCQFDATLQVNRDRLPRLTERVRSACGDLRGAEVALLGLTYKPGTNTLRRSASLELARLLREAGARVRAHDPQVSGASAETRGLELAADPYEAVRGTHAAVLMTPWPEFRAINFGRLREAMARPALVDAHNFLDRTAVEAAGFAYFGVGLGDPPSRRMQKAAS